MWSRWGEQVDGAGDLCEGSSGLLKPLVEAVLRLLLQLLRDGLTFLLFGFCTFKKLL